MTLVWGLCKVGPGVILSPSALLRINSAKNLSARSEILRSAQNDNHLDTRGDHVVALCVSRNVIWAAI